MESVDICAFWSISDRFLGSVGKEYVTPERSYREVTLVSSTSDGYILTRRFISRKAGMLLTRVVNPASALCMITPILKLFETAPSESESIGDVGTEIVLSLVECLTNELVKSVCWLCLERVVECLSAAVCDDVFTMGVSTMPMGVVTNVINRARIRIKPLAYFSFLVRWY